MSLKFKLLSSLLLSSSCVFAQISVEGGDTKTINQDADYAGAITVGKTSADNTFIVTNEAVVGAESLLVGGNSLGNGNLVQIGSESELTITNGITLGQVGSDNDMTVSGALYSDHGVIGEQIQSSGNNVLLNGTNAFWYVESDLIVGGAGSANHIEVMDGGLLSATNITIGAQAGSYGNSVIVTGETSFVFAGEMIVGGAGSGNMLAISNGASAWVGDTYVGQSDTSVSNSLYIGGEGASYLNFGMMQIGTTGNVGNAVTVTNNAMLFSGEGLVISGSNNTFNLDNGGTFLVGTNFNAAMEGFNYNAGSTLGAAGKLTGMTNALEEGRGLILAGTNGSWNMSGSTVGIGESSSSNFFEVINGASASFGAINFGLGTNSFDNTMVISNDAVISVSGMMTVGAVSNSGNVVTIGDESKLLVDGLTIEGSKNSVDLLKGGWLSVSNDLNADGLNYGGGSTLEVGGTLSNLDGTLDEQKTLILNGGSWSVSNLAVGASSSGNRLRVKEGGQFSAGAETVVGSGAGANGNLIEVSGSGSGFNTAALTVGGRGADNRFVLSDGAAVVSSGAVMAGASGSGNRIELGTNTQLTAVGAVTIGQSGKNNTMMLTGGARLTSSGTSSLGDLAGASGNAVILSGSGTSWTNAGDLYVGREGSGSLLTLSDGALVSVTAGDLYIQKGSELRVETDASVSAAGYYQSADSKLYFDRVTGSPVIAGAGTAELEEGAQLNYTGSFASLTPSVTNEFLLIDAAALVVGGTNISNGTVSGLVSETAGSVMDVQFYALANDLYMQMLLNSLKDAAKFADGTSMAEICDEIDAMALNGDLRADAMLSAANTLDSGSLNAHLSTMYEQSAPTYMHMNGMLQGLAAVRRRGLLPEPLWANEPDESAPEGAEGPHRYGRELFGRQSQLWIKGYGSLGSRDEADGISGFDQSVYGTVIGVDKAWGDLLAGIAGGYAGSSIDTEGGGGSDAATGYGTLYAAWGTLEWFSDAHIAYGRSDVETDAGGPFDTKADFNADQVAFYLGGGKEFAFGYERFLLTPSLGLQGGWYMQDGYTESANNAVPRSVDSYDYFSVQSALGVKVATMHQFMTFALMPEISLNWLHEFNDTIDDVDYSLVGGGDYTLSMQSPVADMFELGLGLSSRNEYEDGEVLEFSLRLDGRMGDGYSSVGGSIRAMYEF